MVALACAALLAPAKADSHYCKGEPTAYGVDNCLLDDIAYSADEEGIPLWTAVRKYGWQEQFSEDVDRLQREHPDSYAAAYSGDDPTVWFKGSPPPEIDHAFDNLPVWVKVKVKSAPYTAVETEKIQEVAGDAADALVAEHDLSSIDTEESTGLVTLEISNEDGQIQSSTKALEAGIRAELRRRLPQIVTPPVKVRIVTYSPVIMF